MDKNGNTVVTARFLAPSGRFCLDWEQADDTTISRDPLPNQFDSLEKALDEEKVPLREAGYIIN